VEWEKQSHTLLREVTGKTTGESAEWGRYEQLTERICATRGNVVQALEHLQRAKAIFDAGRTYLEVGRTAYYCAQVWLSLSDANKAHAKLVEAQRIFEQLGAIPDLSHTEQALSSLGIPVAA